MKNYCGILVGLFLSISAFAQPALTGTVRGKIMDARTKEAMEFVNVSIRKAGTTVPLNGTVTDQTGSFELSGIAWGTYVLTASFIGYKPYEKEFTLSSQHPTVNFRTINLQEDSQVLKEVQVTGQRSQMKFEIDRKVFNVDQNIASTGGTASDVLSNIPSVEVDNEGEVSLRGNTSVTVWINGKASGLSADNRAQILEQMPAESIERIEVITNPSAKYSPEGTAGIINIILKQNRKAGYYGNLQAGIDTRGGWNASGNINYSSGKWESYANIGYRKRISDGGGYTNRTNIDEAGQPLSYLNQTTDNTGHGGPVFTRLGTTYHLTLQDHFTLGAFGMFGNRNQKSDLYYESNMPHSFITRERNSDSKNDMKGGNIEFGYKHDFNKTDYLDLTASWNTWNMDATNIYHQHSLFAEGKESISYQRQENDMHSYTWEVQADYTSQLSESSKIEAGYKGTFSKENSPVQTYSGTDVEDAIPDAALYNRFQYDQNIQAIYTTYSGRFNKFGVQAGLRGEYSKVETSSRGYQQNPATVSPYKNDYFSLFPSLFLTYELPAGNEIQANYTRRISRPWGRQLNPFMNITDSTNISFGNPRLSPQYSNAFELNYIKNWENHTLSLSAYYRNTHDVIERISYLQEEVMKSTYENVAKTQAAGTEIVAKNNFARMVDLTTTLNLYYNKLNGFSYLPAGASAPVTGEGSEDFSWNARIIANVTLPYAITMQVTGNYDSRKLVAQGHRKASYTLDAGLRRSFFERKLSLSISGRDLLDSRKRKTETSGRGFVQHAANWRTGRTIGFTLTYSFGNMKGTRHTLRQKQNESDLRNPLEEEF